MSDGSGFNSFVCSVGDCWIEGGGGELFNHVDDNLQMWNGEGDRRVSKEIRFTKGFKEPPNVVLSVSAIDSAQNANLRYWLEPTKVTTKSFVILFSTWGDTRIARAAVNWLAFGEASLELVTAVKREIDRNPPVTRDKVSTQKK